MDDVKKTAVDSVSFLTVEDGIDSVEDSIN